MRKHFKHLRAFVLTVSTWGCLAVFPISGFSQEDGEALIQKARCYACHQLSDTLLAPPYIAIAARHAPRKDVMVDVLARKIVRGGGGNWGIVPMVPNQLVTIAEARIMSEWILSLADD